MKRLAWILSFSVGLLSLSQEILWVRLVAFSQQTRPHAFALVLTAFLVGIALGAVAGRRACRTSDDLLGTAVRVLAAAALVDLAVLWIAADILLFLPPPLVVTVVAIALTAGLKGVLFPIVHHLGADLQAGRLGRSVSSVYLANVAGATIGPILTGFWLLDQVDTEQAWALVAAGTAVLAAALSWRAGAGAHRWPERVAATGVAAGCLAAVLAPPGVVAPMAVGYESSTTIRHLIQNKHGILHVIAEEAPGKGDITFGGNVYDGRVSTDLRVNSNLLERVYLMAAMHPQPRSALMVGLSTGAWASAVAGLEGIEAIDVVEINPGYLELIGRYPQVASLLSDPKVHIHIDDGRRWMRAHPEARYDLIFQNTTFHWRANATALLSREYFELVRSHLRPGGIVATNSTGSHDVVVTAQAVFRHVKVYRGFVYMSDAPLALRGDAEAMLRAARLGGAPAFQADQFEGTGLAAHILRLPLQAPQEVLASDARHGGIAAEVIRDTNVLPEFRHGRPPLFGILEPLLPPSPHPY
jgi:spermidine synthase